MEENKNTISRREFLKLTGLGAAAAAAVSLEACEALRGEELDSETLVGIINNEFVGGEEGRAELKVDHGWMKYCETDLFDREKRSPGISRLVSNEDVNRRLKAVLVGTAIFGPDFTMDNINWAYENPDQALNRLKSGDVYKNNIDVYGKESFSGNENVGLVDIVTGKTPIVFVRGSRAVADWAKVDSSAHIIDEQSDSSVLVSVKDNNRKLVAVSMLHTMSPSISDIDKHKNLANLYTYEITFLVRLLQHSGLMFDSIKDRYSDLGSDIRKFMLLEANGMEEFVEALREERSSSD